MAIFNLNSEHAFASQSGDEENVFIQTGLTKREYFAVLAMQGLCSIPNTGLTMDGFAKRSVEMADALLLELSKSN